MGSFGYKDCPPMLERESNSKIDVFSMEPLGPMCPEALIVPNLRVSLG